MRNKTIVLLLAFAMLAGACSGDDGDSDADDPAEDPDADTTDGGSGAAAGSSGGLNQPGPVSVRLSEGSASTGSVAVDAATVVEGEPLAAAAIVDVVDRLPEWDAASGEQQEFNRPAESLRPPVSGETIAQPFPIDGDEPPPDVDTGPLEVLRVQPEGEVGLAPFVSLTFNQPMIALGTVAQSDANEIPVVLTPELPGRWQWIGTRTLRFEHDQEIFDRLPMATSYTVEVPAGTESASGSVLTDAVRVEFETPAVSVRRITPSGESLDLEPVFVATFDQRVIVDDVLSVTSIEMDGESVPVRLASDDEIAADEAASRIAGREQDGMWMAFRAVDPFVPDAAISIAVGPEIPSAEGPNTSDEVARETARTYAPLRIREVSCPSSRPCQPDRGFWVSFNNQVDGTSIDASDIVIDPAIPGAFIRIRYSELVVEGDMVGDSVYAVTIPASLTDEFGQPLGADETVEIHIDTATPFLDQNEDSLITLDPLVDTQTMPLELRNHDEIRVRAYEATPEDWGVYELYREARYLEEFSEPNWPEIYDEVVTTGAPANERFESRIDLGPVFAGEPGMAVVIIEPVGELANLTNDDRLFFDNRPVVRWVQATSIGADLITDPSRGVVWATDLRTGEPLADVDVRLVGDTRTSTTNGDGIAEFSLPQGVNGFGPLVASLGDDTAITPAAVVAWDPESPAIWYITDDRGLYRPGETIRVKGWVRTLDLVDDATLEFWPAGETITYVVYDAFGNEVASGDTTLSDQGGFDLQAQLPLGANLGQGWIDFARPSTPGRNGGFHQFQIEEFRRPEFDVTARAETEGPYVVSDPATVVVDATYFSGGPLPDAPVDWFVVTRPTSYAPPGWNGFSFGSWVPWWGVFDDGFGGIDPETSSESFSGITDASGHHYLEMGFSGDGEGRPTTVTATASVEDVNRQSWSSTTDLLVHPGERYVGLRSTRSFVREGDGLDVELVVTDIDGAAVSDVPVVVTAERIRQTYENGEWIDVVLDAESCTTESADEPTTCEFALANGGRWTLTATVGDEAGRESLTELTVWVTGGDAVPSRRLERQEATLVPDAAEYAVGDTAEIFVGSPFGPAHGLLTVARNGINEVIPFEIEGSDTIVEVDIDETHVPNVRVSVELVGSTERAADDGTVLPDVPLRPAYATGTLALRVPPATRTLDVRATPDSDAVEPGSSTAVTVEVNDAAGDPVAGAEVLVVAVDEAVLALTGYELVDPLEVFYRSVNDQTDVSFSRDRVRLTDPAALLEYLAGLEAEVEATIEAEQPAERSDTPDLEFASDDMADEDGGGDATTSARANVAPTAFTGYAAGGEAAPPIEVRQDFDALAVWAPEVTTDADGRATVDIDVPDSLTRYRVMAVAVDGADRFGSGESNLTARLPLQVRPSAPRFLNFGDEFELPIVVQNLEDEAVEVDVVLQTSNLVIDGSAGRSVTVPANNRVEVRFPVTTESAGTAQFRAAAVSVAHADAATVSLPIYTPATAEAFATYGVVDGGATIQPFLAPEGVIPQFGGLEVTTSSTAVQALTDAVLYLSEYPYASADGYASRLLAIAALRDVLEAFAVEGIPTPAEFDTVVAADIAALVSLQSGGGWPVWRFGGEISPYRSVHVMHALFEADANGYSVPEATLQQGRSFLRNIEDYIPQEWSARSRDALVSYSLFVRRLDGDVDSAKARAIWNRHGTDFGFDGIAWLWPVVEDAGIEAEIARHVNNAVTETAAAATFTTSYGEEDYLLLHSDRRTDGIVLDALLLMALESDLIPKVVAGLIGNQRQGRWNNAQENAFILLALNNYFDTFEAVDPDFVARVWLGDLYASEHTFEGRSVDSQETVVPMTDVLAIGDDDLVLSKDGDGRLYYRLGLRYAPDDFDLDPLDRGFVVQRMYTGVDDPDDVSQDADGTWRIRAGARVRVELTMVNDSRRTNMALIDPLPAGLEAENPALATTAPTPPIEEFGFGDDVGGDFGDDFGAVAIYDIGRSWWFGTWFDHQNLRDDRVEAFSAYLWAGTHLYDYVARATTPGTFVVPPTRAEEIYAPEVFGRSGSDIVVVE